MENLIAANHCVLFSNNMQHKKLKLCSLIRKAPLFSGNSLQGVMQLLQTKTGTLLVINGCLLASIFRTW